MHIRAVLQPSGGTALLMLRRPTRLIWEMVTLDNLMLVDEPFKAWLSLVLWVPCARIFACKASAQDASAAALTSLHLSLGLHSLR